ncbi:MAG: MotA/TolQ/ExbB proton channel family protein [Pirellulales bacterium]|nr:MotA/TolQ/ExbB proton channel family protein [Pirellulales bacterium]
MDFATILGLVVALAMMAGAVLVSPGASFEAFIDYPSIMVVLGGVCAATLICFPLKRFLQLPAVLRKVFRSRPADVPALVARLVRLSETARRDGLLSLEHKLVELDDPFLVLGIQLAVDGTPPETLEEILRTEMEAVAQRHREAKAMFEQMGRFAPAFGMIGTLLGLVLMLGNMDDPSSIGPGMAVALLTTLYGAVLAYVVFLPISEKLALLSRQELHAREIILRGIQGIQSGDNPRVIEQRLKTYLPRRLRADASREAA